MPGNPVSSVVNWLKDFFQAVEELGAFGFRAFRECFRPPFEIQETANQLFEIGWRSSLLVVIAGFAVGSVLALQTQASMQQFGATALIPQAVSFGLLRMLDRWSPGCLSPDVWAPE